MVAGVGSAGGSGKLLLRWEPPVTGGTSGEGSGGTGIILQHGGLDGTQTSPRLKDGMKWDSEIRWTVLPLGAIAAALFAFEIWRRRRGRSFSAHHAGVGYWALLWLFGRLAFLLESLDDKGSRFANLLGRDRLSATDLVPPIILASRHPGHDGSMKKAAFYQHQITHGDRDC